MTDFLTQIAADLDREPRCECRDTLRGLDRSGCPAHDPEDDDR